MRGTRVVGFRRGYAPMRSPPRRPGLTGGPCYGAAFSWAAAPGALDWHMLLPLLSFLAASLLIPHTIAARALGLAVTVRMQRDALPSKHTQSRLWLRLTQKQLGSQPTVPTLIAISTRPHVRYPLPLPPIGCSWPFSELGRLALHGRQRIPALLPRPRTATPQRLLGVLQKVVQIQCSLGELLCHCRKHWR